MRAETVYIALGSNLEQPLEKVCSGINALAALPRTQLLASSSLYQSAPIGPGVQGDYINAVTKLSTELEPLALLDALQAIEAAHGRTRKVQWEPRKLDLDIVLYGNHRISMPRLTVPHSEMQRRNFVLLPLQEIAPNLVLPDGAPLSAVLAACPANGIEQLATPHQLMSNTKLSNRGAQ